MRRVGTLATLAVGVGLLGASVHGMTNVDQTLKIAASKPTPAPRIDVVREFESSRDCDRERDHGRGHHQPEV
jgi:hypothetical protein